MLDFLYALTDSSKVPEYSGIVRPITYSLGGIIFKSISALAIVIGLMLLIVWLLRRLRFGFSPFVSSNNFIRVISKSSLNSKQSIYLVEVPNGLLILGVSGENISVLSEIKDKDVIENIKNNRSFTFSRYFQDFSKKLKKESPRSQSGLWQ